MSLLIYIPVISCVTVNLLSLLLAHRLSTSSHCLEKILKISEVIKRGAIAYLNRQFFLILAFSAIVAIILDIFFGTLKAIAFSLGSVFSAISAYLGTLVAVNTNSKTANSAKDGFLKAFSVAFSGGMIAGLSLTSFGLIAVAGLYILFSAFGYNDMSNLVGLAFGASLSGLFARVGGGIYTKAADIAADVVGKIEMGLPEDDPRNPAVIADQVGDNVGDIAGTGSDVFQSYVCMLVASIILGAATHGYMGALYPLIVSGFGLISSAANLLSIKFVSRRFRCLIYKVMYIPAVLTAIASAIASRYLLGNMMAFFPTLIGIISILLLAHITNYYTSPRSRAVEDIIRASRSGPAINILTGFSTGLEAVLLPILVISAVIFLAYYINGLYGVSLAAVGFLSIMATFVSMAAYGPIVDNANGLITMSKMGDDLRRTMDMLDSIGNVTKAICKVYAIGTSALAQVALFSTYLASARLDVINAADPQVITGILIGGSLSFILCSLVIKAVSKASHTMIKEIHKQFAKPLSPHHNAKRKSKPGFIQCIEICTRAALRGMFPPAILSVAAPFAIGFLLGKEALGGLIVGNLVTTLPLSLFMCISGASWDNAKKRVEIGAREGNSSPLHAATVIGDTVGDPLKDAAGPSLDIFINLIGTVALIYVARMIQP
ncbi:MAG: sodium-translocating pyrophosphatase [Candidatus Bathyarchaeia archaeon]|nr:sodium-translocating pyrophosphatase [Candidatus Bathyarchaeota archaeon]